MLTFRRKLVIATCQYDENIRLGQIVALHANTGEEHDTSVTSRRAPEVVHLRRTLGATARPVDLYVLDPIQLKYLGRWSDQPC